MSHRGVIHIHLNEQVTIGERSLCQAITNMLTKQGEKMMILGTDMPSLQMYDICN